MTAAAFIDLPSDRFQWALVDMPQSLMNRRDDLPRHLEAFFRPGMMEREKSRVTLLCINPLQILSPMPLLQS
jgi:hypothetical protein